MDILAGHPHLLDLQLKMQQYDDVMIKMLKHTGQDVKQLLQFITERHQPITRLMQDNDGEYSDEFEAVPANEWINFVIDRAMSNNRGGITDGHQKIFK